jgi:cytidylate kinase
MRAKNAYADYNEVLDDLKRRDERDMNRSASPLRQPSDAHLIDTSKMDIEAAFLEAKKLIDAALRS